MDRKFYGGNGRNVRDYGHNRNIQPMAYKTNWQVGVRLTLAMLLFVGVAGTSVIVAFS